MRWFGVSTSYIASQLVTHSGAVRAPDSHRLTVTVVVPARRAKATWESPSRFSLARRSLTS